MRVGVDLSPLFYGMNRTRGIGIYVENLAAALAAHDTRNEYVLLTTRGTQPYTLPFPLPSNFSLAPLSVPPLGRATPLVSHQLILPLSVRGLKLDVLHMLQAPYNLSLPAVSFWQRVPTIVTVFDIMPLRLGDALLKFGRYRHFFRFQLDACRRAARLITATENTAAELAQHGIAPRDKISVVPLAAPPRDEGETPSAHVRAVVNGAPFFLHVGGDEPQKNQEIVLRAFGALCRNPAFKHNLVLVGQHHLGDDAALAQSTRAALRILRLSELTRADLDALYDKCQALVFPSSYEGFGLPVLEAMRAGAPVVTSNTSCLPEVAGDAALLIDPQDASALSNAMRRVLDDERLRVKLRQAGERRARQFTWERTAQLTRAVYELVGQARRAPSPTSGRR
ncbi:MAG: glycosyltransferase family 4 protein [Anaerolineae bacterium]|nr:glycosyltransferase family 4 protein [Anaerolineae bacterium]